MLNKRGFSFVDWAVVFGVVLAAAAIFVVPIKRAITSRTMLTTDHLLWGIWGSEVMEEGGWNHNQIGAMVTETRQSTTHKTLEREGKVRTILDAESGTTSSHSSY